MTRPRQPRRRIARALGVAIAGLVVVVLGIWVGTALWVQRLNEGMTFRQTLDQVAEGAGSFVACSVFECKVEVAGGMRQRLWADAGMLADPPVAIDADEHGRLFVAEGGRFYGGAEDNRNRPFWLDDDLAARTVEDRAAYIEKWIAAGAIEADVFRSHRDRLVVLEDTDRDGTADSRRELVSFGDLVDGILAGVLVRDGEAWLTDVPSVYHLDDPDGDGIPDRPTRLSTGYGVATSLQGHDLHGLVFGPDGRIYFSLGDRGYHVALPDGRVLEPPMGVQRGAVFRMLPDGSQLEVFATGLRNPQELAFDDAGNLFTGDNNSDGGDEARIVYVVDGGDSGWAMPYQSLGGDEPRGPWNAERLWHLYHPGQPAWIVPPIAHLARGPAGFAHNPGLGLPERYADHFFLSDFRYMRGISQIWSFAVAPDGAGFRMVDEHVFMSNVLPTDLAFSFDGRLFVAQFEPIEGDRQILVAEPEGRTSDPRLARTADLAREGMRGREPAELAELLGYPDQRIRLRAQVELVRRREAAPLAAVAHDRAAPRLARFHALWGLGQLGADGAAAAGTGDLAWADAEEPELRAQVARVIGEMPAGTADDALIGWLGDASPRVRFFAAQSLGRLAVRAAVPALYELVRENGDRDPFLRHAAVAALDRIGDVDAALARSGDPSAAVRLAVLLQLRRSASPEIARFLSDVDPFLVVEAARAIYDVPIPGAMDALAALPDTHTMPEDDDPQSSGALHRRVIGANRTLGSARAAERLAAYAVLERHPLAMRRLALETLAEFTKPAPRDLAMSWWRPLPERDPEVVYPALDRYGPTLVAGDLGARALEIASAYGRVALPDAELAALVADTDSPSERRLAALAALAARRGEGLDAAIEQSLAGDDGALRARARAILAGLRPEAALASIAAVPDDAPLAERQAAWETLRDVGGERAVPLAAAGLDRLAAGTLDPALELDVLEAAASLGSPELDARLAQQSDRSARSEAAGDPVAPRHYALSGGDPERGRRVFQARGDCQRCHGGEGHAAGAGPDLAGVAARRDLRYVLESVLDPQAEIAPGFASISLVLADGEVVSGRLLEESEFELRLDVGGKEQSIPTAQIRERSPTTSGMPPVGLALSPRELRDLIAYVATL